MKLKQPDQIPSSVSTAHSFGRGSVVLLSLILTWQTISSTSIFPPGDPGFLYMIWKAGVILPLHEAGHLIFTPLGYALTIFGGSFWQVAFPLMLLVVALRQGSFWWTVYLTLTGVHLIDLTPYIFDAPFRSLPLITGNKHTHDWGNLLNHFQAQHHAERLADLAFYGGAFAAIAGLGMSVFFIARGLWPNAFTWQLARLTPVPNKRRAKR